MCSNIYAACHEPRATHRYCSTNSKNHVIVPASVRITCVDKIRGRPEAVALVEKAQNGAASVMPAQDC